MFKWLIDRQIRAELADLAHSIAKQNGKIEALEDEIISFKSKWREKAKKKLKDDETDEAESVLAGLTDEDRAFIEGLSPYERAELMQKLNNPRSI